MYSDFMHFPEGFAAVCCGTRGYSGQISDLTWPFSCSPTLISTNSNYWATQMLFSFAEGNPPAAGILPVTNTMSVHGNL